MLHYVGSIEPENSEGRAGDLVLYESDVRERMCNLSGVREVFKTRLLCVVDPAIPPPKLTAFYRTMKGDDPNSISDKGQFFQLSVRGLREAHHFLSYLDDQTEWTKDVVGHALHIAKVDNQRSSTYDEVMEHWRTSTFPPHLAEAFLLMRKFVRNAEA